MGVAANALRGPPVGDTRTELGRRTPWWGENFGTAGPTAKRAATTRGIKPTAKRAATAIPPRKARLIDTLSPLASTGLWRVPRLSFTRSNRWQHETPPQSGLASGPTPLCPSRWVPVLALTFLIRLSRSYHSQITHPSRHRLRPEKP